MVVVAIIEIAVSIVLMIYLLKQKTGTKYSAGAVIKFVGFGALALISGLAISLLANFNLHWLDGKNPILYGLFAAFVTAAIFEEVIKYIFFRLSLIKNKGAVNHLDVIIGAALVGIGFTIAENIEYAIGGAGNILRALLPMHILFQLVMGYFYGKALVTKKWIYHVLSIAAPVVLHGLFDMPIICEKAVLGDVGTGQFTNEYISSLPYGSYLIPLFVALILVSACMLALFIILLVKVGKWSKAGKMQELLRAGEQGTNE